MRIALICVDSIPPTVVGSTVGGIYSAFFGQALQFVRYEFVTIFTKKNVLFYIYESLFNNYNSIKGCYSVCAVCSIAKMYAILISNYEEDEVV